MKHTLCDLQEKIFHLQIQLLEEDIAGGETETNESPDLGLWRRCQNVLPFIQIHLKSELHFSF